MTYMCASEVIVDNGKYISRRINILKHLYLNFRQKQQITEDERKNKEERKEKKKERKSCQYNNHQYFNTSAYSAQREYIKVKVFPLPLTVEA